MRNPVTLGFARVLLLLALFSALAFCGVCPSWFLGLSIAIGLLRFSGWVLLKIHGGATGVQPGNLPQWNVVAQLIWAVALGGEVAAGWLFPALPRLSAVLLDSGYLTLACLQIAAFFRTFSHYRPLLLAELTLRNAPV